jgi:protein ImuB
LHLLPWPEPIEVMAPVPDGPPVLFRWRRAHHRIAAAEGPERIEPEWWREEDGHDPARRSSVRDYYRVEDAQGHRFWIYREGFYRPDAAPRWYLHGLFP